MVIRKNDPRVMMAPQYAATPRTTRRPQHRFNLRFLPYQIQPMLLAPVLPGETFTTMMLQSQCWSDPLKPAMKNIGWWLQWNFFYVRHRDLPAAVRNILADMFVNPETADLSSLQQTTADNKPLYTFLGGVKWTELCLQHVVSQFFRDEGEDYDASEIGGLPAAKIFGRGSSDGIEKLTLDEDYEDRRVELIGSDNKLYANELSSLYGHWAAMYDAGLTDMDYQDFMKTYGSTVREDEESENLHRAEDLWSMRDFTYPTNTIEPTTGVPAVAAGWRTQKSGGKRVFCDEPGFIFGVVYTRPKVYMRALKGSLAGGMSDVRSWLPAVLHEQGDLGHIKYDGDAGPLRNVFSDGGAPATYEDYWLDVRDLLLYGDQFVNYDMTGEVPFLSLPDADANRRYAAESEVKAMFATSETGNFEADGICSLSILGRQKDTTRGLVLGKA